MAVAVVLWALRRCLEAAPVLAKERGQTGHENGRRTMCVRSWPASPARDWKLAPQCLQTCGIGAGGFSAPPAPSEQPSTQPSPSPPCLAACWPPLFFALFCASLEWMLRKCRFAADEVLNACGHVSEGHGKGRSPVCVRLWASRWALMAKLRPQVRHRNGRSPVCTRPWRFKAMEEKKRLPHSVHGNRRSSSWLKRCSTKVLSCR